MKAKTSLIFGLLVAVGMSCAQAQQSNEQYYQEQAARQRQAHEAEQARIGHTLNQEQLRQQAAQPQQPAPSGYWKTTWGAIGGNAAKGILGAAVGMASEQEAIQAALTDCRAKGGEDGCKLDISYYNQCAALVTGDKLYNTTSAPTIEEASRLGINKCSKEDVNCRVFYADCSKPQFIRH